MKELLEAMGWIEIPSNNPYMHSYKKEDKRMNYYFTTGTVTIQGTDGSFEKFMKIFDESQMEKIL